MKKCYRLETKLISRHSDITITSKNHTYQHKNFHTFLGFQSCSRCLNNQRKRIFHICHYCGTNALWWSYLSLHVSIVRHTLHILVLHQSRIAANKIVLEIHFAEIGLNAVHFDNILILHCRPQGLSTQQAWRLELQINRQVCRIVRFVCHNRVKNSFYLHRERLFQNDFYPNCRILHFCMISQITFGHSLTTDLKTLVITGLHHVTCFFDAF